jgi:hypothetical protein
VEELLAELDETRVVVLDVADACAHRPADHFFERVGSKAPSRPHK